MRKSRTRFFPLNRLILLSAILVLSACASTGGPATGGDDSKSGKPVKVQKIPDPSEYKPSSPDAALMYQIMVADLAVQRGMTDVALKYYLSAAKLSHDPEIASKAVRVATFLEANKEALEAAQIWEAEAPDSLDAKRVLAVLYLRTGELEKGKKLLDELLAKDPEQIDRTILHIGSMLQREIPKEQAYELSAYFAQRYADSPEANYVAASLAVNAEREADALTYIDKALHKKKDWVDAVVLKAKILQGLDRQKDALAFLKKFLNTHASQDSVRLVYARTLIDARKYKDARNQFEMLAVRMPDNEDVLFALAMLSLQFKEYDEAKGYLLQLDKLGKRTPQISYYLGQIAEQKKDYEEALNWYTLIRPGDYYLDAQLRIAAVTATSKSLDDARKLLRNIETDNPDDKREIVLFEANLLKDRKMYQESYDVLTKALKTYAKDIDILYDRSLVLERLNRVDESIRDLEYIVKKQPENAAALNALGYTLADRTDRTKEALEYLNRALELQPDDPALMDSMGWVYYRLGDNKQALDYLRKAMDMIEDGEVSAHYGEVLWAAGEKDEAVKVWNKALQKFKDNDILKKTMGRFGQ